MFDIIDKYIDKLMTSKPDLPLWNIEAIHSGKKPVWNYIDGCMMTSLIELYKTTNDEKYINFVKKFVDYYVFGDGTIRGYDPNKYSTDDVCESRILFDLYEMTNDEKYSIRWHMGFSEPKELYGTLGQAFTKYPLALLLHEADLEATYFFNI